MMIRWLSVLMAMVAAGCASLSNLESSPRFREGHCPQRKPHQKLREVANHVVEGLLDQFQVAAPEWRSLRWPRWTLQNRPYVDGAKPAIGAGAQAGVL